MRSLHALDSIDIYQNKGAYLLITKTSSYGIASNDSILSMTQRHRPRKKV